MLAPVESLIVTAGEGEQGGIRFGRIISHGQEPISHHRWIRGGGIGDVGSEGVVIVIDFARFDDDDGFRLEDDLDLGGCRISIMINKNGVRGGNDIADEVVRDTSRERPAKVGLAQEHRSIAGE